MKTLMVFLTILLAALAACSKTTNTDTTTDPTAENSASMDPNVAAANLIAKTEAEAGATAQTPKAGGKKYWWQCSLPDPRKQHWHWPKWTRCKETAKEVAAEVCTELAAGVPRNQDGSTDPSLIPICILSMKCKFDRDMVMRHIKCE